METQEQSQSSTRERPWIAEITKVKPARKPLKSILRVAGYNYDSEEDKRERTNYNLYLKFPTIQNLFPDIDITKINVFFTSAKREPILIYLNPNTDSWNNEEKRRKFIFRKKETEQQFSKSSTKFVKELFKALGYTENSTHDFELKEIGRDTFNTVTCEIHHLKKFK